MTAALMAEVKELRREVARLRDGRAGKRYVRLGKRTITSADGFWAFLREPRLSYPIEYHSTDTDPSCPPTIEQFYGVYSWVEAEEVSPDGIRPYRFIIKSGGRFGTAGGGGGEDCGGARDVNMSNEAWEYANKIVWLRYGKSWENLSTECPSSEVSSSTITIEGVSEATINLYNRMWFDGGSTGREECFQRFDISFAVNNNLPA